MISAGGGDPASINIGSVHLDVLSDPDMAGFSSIGDLDSKHGGVDGKDNYWWHQQTSNGIIKMSGIPPIPVITSARDLWSLYK